MAALQTPFFSASLPHPPTIYEPPFSLAPSIRPVLDHLSPHLLNSDATTRRLRRPPHSLSHDIALPHPVPNLELHSAAASGNVGLVHYALTHGQPVNSVLHGVLPLHAACSGGSVSVVRMLIERGADVNAPRLPRRYSDGKKPNVPSVGAAGSTPLHFAAANGHAPIVQILLTCGAIPDKADKNGMTPEALAEINGHTDVIRVLRVWEHLKLQESQSAQSSNSNSGNQDGSEPLAIPSPSTSLSNIDEDAGSLRYGSLGSRKGKERALSFVSNTSDASAAVRMKKSVEGFFKGRSSRSASFVSSIHELSSEPSNSHLSIVTGVEVTPDKLPSPIDLTSPTSPSPLRDSLVSGLDGSASEVCIGSAAVLEASSPISPTNNHSPSIRSTRSMAAPATLPIRIGPVPKRSNTTTSRRPSLPSIIEKATHPGAAFRAAMHRDKARSPEISPSGSSSPSRSTSLFRGRHKSNESTGSPPVRRSSNASRKYMSKHALLHLFRRGQSPPSRSPSPPHRTESTKIIAAEDIDDGIERLKRASIDLDMRERQLTPDDGTQLPADSEIRPVPASAPSTKTKFFPDDPDAPPVPNLDLSLYPQFSHLAPLITPSSITPSNFVERTWSRARATSDVMTPSPLANEWQRDPEPGQGIRRSRTEIIMSQSLTEPLSEVSSLAPLIASPSSPLRPTATKPRSATLPGSDMVFTSRLPPNSSKMYGLSWRDGIGLRKMASSLFWKENERARRESEKGEDADHEADAEGQAVQEDEEQEDSDGEEFLDTEGDLGMPEDQLSPRLGSDVAPGSVRSGVSSTLDSTSSQKSGQETLENQRPSSGSETEREDGTEKGDGEGDTATERGDETEMEADYTDTDGEVEYHDALMDDPEEAFEELSASVGAAEVRDDGPTTPTASKMFGRDAKIDTNVLDLEPADPSTPTAADVSTPILRVSGDSTAMPTPLESPTTPVPASGPELSTPIQVEPHDETIAPVEEAPITVETLGEAIKQSSEAVVQHDEATAPVEKPSEVPEVLSEADAGAPVDETPVSTETPRVEVDDSSETVAQADVATVPDETPGPQTEESAAPVRTPNDETEESSGAASVETPKRETEEPTEEETEAAGPLDQAAIVTTIPAEPTTETPVSGEVPSEPLLATKEATAHGTEGNPPSAEQDDVMEVKKAESQSGPESKRVILEKISPPRSSGSRFVESFDKTVEVREPPKPSPPKSSRWGRRFRGAGVGTAARASEAIHVNTPPTALQMSSIKTEDIAERSPVKLADSKMHSPPPPPPSIASGIDTRSRGKSISSTASSAAYSYMQTVSTPATSLTPPSLLSITLGSGFPPVPEDAVAHPVARRKISSRAEAADMVKRAEDDVLQLAQLPPSLDSSRSLAAQLAAYGDSHALEQEFVEREKRRSRRVGSGSEFDSSDQGSFVSAKSDPSGSGSVMGSSARTGTSTRHPARRTPRQAASFYSVEHPITSVPSINTIYDKRAAAYRERMQALTSLPPVIPPGSPRSHPRPRAASSDAWLNAGPAHRRAQDVHSEADADRYPNISSPMPFVSSDLIPPRPQKKHSLQLPGRSSASVSGVSSRMTSQHSNLSTASMARSLSPLSMSTRLGAPSIRAASSYRQAPAPIADVVSTRYQGMSPPSHAPYISIFSSRYAGTPHDGGDSDDEEQAPARLTVIENDWRGGHVVGGGLPAESLKKAGKWGNLKGAIGHLGGRK